MKTTFRIRQPYADLFLDCARRFRCVSPARPERFIRKLKENTGVAGAVFGLTDRDGLERRNPLIVALGDSVTAGHFESIADPEQFRQMGALIEALQRGESREEIARRITAEGGLPPMEIYDARESYLEKFREKLIEKYEYTSVSVVNSGIAGDVLPSMARRAWRDVIRYDPDLILVNGSLNWTDEVMGDAEEYKRILRELVRRFRGETEADVILLTPNGDLPNALFSAPGQGVPEPTTEQRAEKIRELAAEEGVCLADVRAVWTMARDAGCPWEELLANRINHPSVEGHEVYAQVLMKLFEEPENQA